MESNLKSNLSVFFSLLFFWVSTTAAITTVLPAMKLSQHRAQVHCVLVAMIQNISSQAEHIFRFHKLFSVFLTLTYSDLWTCSLSSEITCLILEQLYIHKYKQAQAQLLTAGWSSGSRALGLFVRYRVWGVVSGRWRSWGWDSIRLLWQVLTQSP